MNIRDDSQPRDDRPTTDGWSVRYELQHVDRHCHARLGKLITPRGEIQLPAFMPVGTLATVKGVTPDQISETGAEIVLANTYHLALRPGHEVVKQLGGLHTFMGWPGPILTDSGGFQIFSLAKLTTLDDHGVSFRSHVDGSLIELTPSRAMEIQGALGSDIAMVLDQCPALPASRSVIEESCERTLRWAKICRDQPRDAGQSVFGIVQGGLESDWRRRCAQQLIEMDFAGYAIGGLSVGEKPQDMFDTVAATTPCLPVDRPRYLMGVGRPEDLLANIARGIDMFDCVMPTRNGRNALAFTDSGPLRLRNQAHQVDPRPLDERTPGRCSGLSRGYIRHLFMAGEMLGPILLTLHNLTYYQQILSRAREAIAADSFLDFFRERLHGWSLDTVPFLPSEAGHGTAV